MSWITNWRNKTKHNCTWNNVHKFCKDVVEEQWSGPPPCCIVGISRGGLVPAAIVANLMGVRKIFSVGVASYMTDTSRKAEEFSIYQHIPTGSTTISDGVRKGDSVLIIDDISDKGKTLNSVVNGVREMYDCKIRTMSLYIKHSTEFVPDMYYRSVPDKTWVTFPWEV